MAVISHGLKILEKILAGFCKKTVKILLEFNMQSYFLLLMYLPSIQDQAELSSLIRLEMATKSV